MRRILLHYLLKAAAVFCAVALFFTSTVTITKAAQSGKKPASLPRATTLSLAPLEVREFQIDIKNTGTRAWGKGPDALILRTAARRESYLYHSSWLARTAVLSMPGGVRPRTVATVQFFLASPAKEGDYTETFTLFSGKQPIPSSSFVLKIRVEKKSSPPVVFSPRIELAAMRLIQSDDMLTMPALGRTVFRAGFKNQGSRAWTLGGEEKISLRSSARRESYFYDATTWTSGNVVSPLQEGAAPGQVSFFQIILEAPQKVGPYTETLALYAGDKKLAGTDVTIPILVARSSPQTTLASAPALTTVQQLSPSVPSSFSTSTVTNSAGLLSAESSSTPSFIPQGIVDDFKETEPIIRIGLLTTQEPIRITAQKDYEIRDTANMLLAHAQTGSVTTVVYDAVSKQTTVTTPQLTATSSLPVRFLASQATLAKGVVWAAAVDPFAPLVPTSTVPAIPPAPLQSSATSDQDIVFEILSYTNRPGWSTTLNDNKFRAVLEVRYAQSTQKLWVINELKVEEYLKGIAETSNNSPYEYQKALIIAARTYALHHISRGTKYLAEQFTMKTTDADQVYRGYGAEIRLPAVTRAVNETRGAIVTYNGNLAITPYFSQSDGRTRSWQEVWAGGPYPWIVGKADPCCTKLPKLGHGVGMSARGALMMALDGKGFEEILRYYYTGIELRRRYL